MGGVWSKSEVNYDSVAKSMNKAVIKNIQKCAPSLRAINLIDVTGDHNEIQNVMQRVTLVNDQKCWFDANNQQELVTDVIRDVVVDAKSTGGLFGPLFANNTINTGTVTDVIMDSYVENVQDCATELSAGSTLRITGNFNKVNGVVQESEAQNLVECAFGVDNTQSLITTIQDTMNLSAGGKVESGMSWVTWLVIAIVVLTVAGFLFWIIRKNMSKGGGGSTSRGQPTTCKGLMDKQKITDKSLKKHWMAQCKKEPACKKNKALQANVEKCSKGGVYGSLETMCSDSALRLPEGTSFKNWAKTARGKSMAKNYKVQFERMRKCNK
jgi:hypothetical protein